METSISDEAEILHFVCEKCNYKCSKNFLWKQHLMTKKHAKHKKYAVETFEKKDPKHHLCNICGMQYMTRSGLWKHKRTGNCENIIDHSMHVENNSTRNISKSNRYVNDCNERQ